MAQADLTALRELPSVEVALHALEPFVAESGVPRGIVLESVRCVLDDTRQRILNGAAGASDADRERLLERVRLEAERRWRTSLPRAVNATGILLHTGLGRAPLSPLAQDYVREAMARYAVLAFGTETGARRERHFHLEELIPQVTGAESGILVNNNAAATTLVLKALCEGREAVVSRGELVEIGGSFRIPEVMSQSGCVMREVGTTNRTHLRDYENAINEHTGLLVKIHKSNYKLVGFSSEPPLEAMVALGKKYDIPVYHDLGSGALVDFARHGLYHEPTVQESVQAGADVVSFSGDKLLGGPQSGLIVGKKAWIDMIKKHPLMRAVRCDKLIYAAMEGTLKTFVDEGTALSENATVRALVEPVETLKARAHMLLKDVRAAVPDSARWAVEEAVTYVGSGSMPGEPVPTVVLALRDATLPPERIANRLRQAQPAVFTRVQDGAVLFDLRTLAPEEFPWVVSALGCAWEGTI